MAIIYATESNPFQKTGIKIDCTEAMAETLLKKGFAVADGEEPKQAAKPKQSKIVKQ